MKIQLTVHWADNNPEPKYVTKSKLISDYGTIKGQQVLIATVEKNDVDNWYSHDLNNALVESEKLGQHPYYFKDLDECKAAIIRELGIVVV